MTMERITAVTPLRGLELALRNWADRQHASLHVPELHPGKPGTTERPAGRPPGLPGLQAEISKNAGLSALLAQASGPPPSSSEGSGRLGQDMEHFMQTLVRSFGNDPGQNAAPRIALLPAQDGISRAVTDQHGTDVQAGAFARALSGLIAGIEAGHVPPDLKAAFERIAPLVQGALLPPFALPPGTITPPPERTASRRDKKTSFAHPDSDEAEMLALLSFLGQLRSQLSDPVHDPHDKPLGVLVDVDA